MFNPKPVGGRDDPTEPQSRNRRAKLSVSPALYSSFLGLIYMLHGGEKNKMSMASSTAGAACIARSAIKGISGRSSALTSPGSI